MNHNSMPPDDSWETDAVWQLLDQVPPRLSNTRFTTDTVRAARIATVEKRWWSHLLSPAPLAGLAATTAALTLAILSLVGPTKVAETDTAMLDSPQAIAIQDIAETETLIAAADQLDDFSDSELVGLIGF